MEVRIARWSGISGVVRSRASASRRDAVGSSLATATEFAALSFGCGVPMSSGGGDPATDE